LTALSERRRILLVAATTGYQTRMFAEAAERAGVELVLATDRCHVLDDPWGDHALAIKFDDPVLDYDRRLDGIIAVGDKPAFVAARLAVNRGLRFHSPDAVGASRNKFLARKRFRDAGLLVPEFYQIAVSKQPTGARFYPCVLKPLGLSASRGVIRANDDAEFLAAFRRIRALLEREELNHAIQVERFIAGREFALEGVMDGGRLEAIALFDKPDPLDGPFFEETIYVTPSREPESIQAAIFETAERAVQALGLSDGPIHAEMRVNPEGVWMLEVAARPIGGLCAKAIPGLEEFLLRRAAGEAVPPPALNGGSGVMMIPIPREGVYVETLGAENAAAVPGISEVIITAKQGHKIVPLPEGASYLGFIFARAGTSAEAEQALRSAHRELQFEILGALPVL
jgi:biotin carboxylase